MLHLANMTIGQSPQRATGTKKITIGLIALLFLLACPAESQAQRSGVYWPRVKPTAERRVPPPRTKPVPPRRAKPVPPPRANAPVITSIPVVDERYIDIHFQNFAADVSKMTLERKLVTKYGTHAWRVIWSVNIRDHRGTFNSNVRNNKRTPGAKYVYHETAGLVPGDKYQYRVRATQSYKPNPVVLVSAAKTVTVLPQTPTTEPTPPNPTDSDPIDTDPTDSTQTDSDPTLPPVVHQMVYLKAKPIGQYLRPYAAISFIAGEITEIKIPKTEKEQLQVYFAKPGYKFAEYSLNPDATVMLTSGQASTPSQINELFGSGKKKLPVTFIAFVRTSGTWPKSVAMKVSYSESN